MKRILLKGFCFLIFLAATLVIANAVYVRWFYKADILEADAKMLLDVDSLQNTCDVLYFGESSNATYSKYDTCPLAISQLINRQVPDIRIGTVQHGAIHAKIYLDLVRNIKPGSRVKTIIVTMNLRSFNAFWINSILETPLMKADVMYKPYPPIIKRLMMAFSAFDNREWPQREKDIQWHWVHDKINLPPGFKYKNTKEWDNGRAMAGIDTLPGGKWDMEKIQLACNYVKIFGFSIDTVNNPRIRDFDELVKVAKKKNLHLVFNLMSENTRYADSLVGKELVALMRENRDLLVKRYNRDGVIVVDNLELVAGKDFIEQSDGVSEHYNQVGRWCIATHLVSVAGKYLRK